VSNYFTGQAASSRENSVEWKKALTAERYAPSAKSREHRANVYRKLSRVNLLKAEDRLSAHDPCLFVLLFWLLAHSSGLLALKSVKDSNSNSAVLET